MNLLKKTYCTVIGPMQYGNGRPIREFFERELGKMGVTLFNHYHKPFLFEEPESEAFQLKLASLMKEEKYDEVSSYKSIRSHDLNMIDRSDFIIFDFVPGVITVGSWEEWKVALSSRKPLFFITEGGKKLTPLWVMWAMPHKYIYNNKEEVLETLKKIDSGKKELDSTRWRLLREEFR